MWVTARTLLRLAAVVSLTFLGAHAIDPAAHETSASPLKPATHAEVEVNSNGQQLLSSTVANSPSASPQKRALLRRHDPPAPQDLPQPELPAAAPAANSSSHSAATSAAGSLLSAQQHVEALEDESHGDDHPYFAAGNRPSSALQLDQHTEQASSKILSRRRRAFTMTSAYSYDFNGNFYDDILDITDGELTGPFSIEFSARWDAFNRWSRILDIGEGPRSDNIIVANSATPRELAFYIYNGTKSRGFKIPGAIDLGVMSTYMLTLSEYGHMRVWKDGAIIGEFDDAFVPRQIHRSHFYVGKSNWENTPLFQGSIQDLYIWSGEATAWGTRDTRSYSEIR